MIIKIKSTHPASQGQFVVIDRAAFDAEKHEPFDDEARAAVAGVSGGARPTMEELLTARDQLIQMRADLDAEAVRLNAQAAAQVEAQRLIDEQAKRLAEGAGDAKPNTGKPSEGLKVEELKAALEAKNIAIPDGVTLKADLAALLDGAA